MCQGVARGNRESNPVQKGNCSNPENSPRTLQTVLQSLQLDPGVLWLMHVALQRGIKTTQLQKKILSLLFLQLTFCGGIVADNSASWESGKLLFSLFFILKEIEVL